METKPATQDYDVPKALDEMSKEEFDTAMAIGLEQARQGKSVPVDEAFDALSGEIANGSV